jgi:hypothetical protein
VRESLNAPILYFSGTGQKLYMAQDKNPKLKLNCPPVGYKDRDYARTIKCLSV